MKKQHRHIGFFAGLLLARLKTKRPVSPADLKASDLDSNTRKIGIIYTDKIRSVFRSKWLKIH